MIGGVQDFFCFFCTLYDCSRGSHVGGGWWVLGWWQRLDFRLAAAIRALDEELLRD